MSRVEGAGVDGEKEFRIHPADEDAQALAEDRGAQFVLAANPPGEIRADPDLLRQMLLNLVTNAVSVSPPQGRVSFESIRRADQRWRFVVLDEGPGLPAQQLERIFERFTRFEHAGRGDVPRRAGHGLGLAICRSIVALHGGEIRAENRPDRSGLRVIVELPPVAGGTGSGGADHANVCRGHLSRA